MISKALLTRLLAAPWLVAGALAQSASKAAPLVAEVYQVKSVPFI